MIGVDRLIEKLNSLISGGSLTELEVTQLSKVIDTLEKKGVSSVLSTSYLPNVVENKGRLFWLQTEQRYVYSNGISWEAQNLFKYYVNLYTWGLNGSGRLGTGNTSARNSPGSVLTKTTDWITVTGGSVHSAALRANGTLWSWGYNRGFAAGILGDGTILDRSSPVSVIGGFTNWTMISAGGGHILGLQANGTLWAWGGNNQGQLGTGNTSSRSSPVSVIGGFTNWIFASSGSNSIHSIGLLSNGVLYAWGFNNQGQLGDNTVSNRSSPVSVVGGFTDWTFAALNSGHSLGLRANGTIWAWGGNQYGRLGDNTTSFRSSPVSVVGGFTDWIFVSAGNANSLGLRANGTAWTWGRNSYGQLGTNDTSNRSSPVSVVGGFTDWNSISVGTDHILGIRANGTMWGWGRNQYGQLGTSNYSNRSSPVSVVGGFTDWVTVSSAHNHSAGIRAV